MKIYMEVKLNIVANVIDDNLSADDIIDNKLGAKNIIEHLDFNVEPNDEIVEVYDTEVSDFEVIDAK